MKKLPDRTSRKKLVLRREAIALLASNQLSGVVGGNEDDECSNCSRCCVLSAEAGVPCV
jgi:hypothetical protein